MPNRQLRALHFAITTHSYATGPSFRLEEYLRDRAASLVFISHPFPYAADTRSCIRIYQNGDLVQERRFRFRTAPDLVFYAKDVLLTLWWLRRRRIDYFVAVDNLNAFSATLLKLAGRVRKSIYYTIDYVPKRFANGPLNAVYHWLDRSAVRRSDVVWNLSDVMVDEREKRGVSAAYRAKQMVVPIGTDPQRQASRVVDRNKIVFMGHLRAGQGVETLVAALPRVLERVPRAHLLVIGGGPLEATLTAEVQRLGLAGRVEFTGFVDDFSAVERAIEDAAVAVAPYVDDDTTFTRYTDPGKVKDYLARGVPVVVTKVPRVAFEVDRRRCGIAIDDDQTQLADALIRLLEDTRLQDEFRTNALAMARDYEWSMLFDRALTAVLRSAPL